MAGSYLLSNTGWWMQLTALNWLVLGFTGSPAAAGLTSALVFLPTLVLGMFGGVLADRFPKRRIVLFFYIGWAALTAVLAALTLSHLAQVWQVQLIAAALGTVYALCWPGQQAFVAELVGQAQLRSAISITSSVTQLATLLGPAIGGLLISVAGVGWSFLAAAACYLMPVIAVSMVRNQDLTTYSRTPEKDGQLRTGLRFAVKRPDVLWPTILVGLFGMFTGNLPVILAVYAKSVFDIGPGGYGLLAATVAVGSLIGALISARQHHTRLRTLVLFAGFLSGFYILSAAAPSEIVFCVVLLGVGATTLLLQTSAASTVQLAAHDQFRGRVVAIYVLAYSGGIALGGPLVGTVVELWGPSNGMLLAGILPGTATLLIAGRLTWRVLSERRIRPLYIRETEEGSVGRS